MAEGWKTTMIPVTGKKVLRKHFLSPDGHFFSSWIKALEFMRKEGIFLKENIEGMKLGLLGEDWEIDQLLPPGWGVRPNKHNKFVQLSRKNIRMDKCGGKAKKDSTVPEGWKCKASACAPGAPQKVQIIQCSIQSLGDQRSPR